MLRSIFAQNPAKPRNASSLAALGGLSTSLCDAAIAARIPDIRRASIVCEGSHSQLASACDLISKLPLGLRSCKSR